MIKYKDSNGIEIKEFDRLLIKKNNVIYYNNAQVEMRKGRLSINGSALKNYMNGDYYITVLGAKEIIENTKNNSGEFVKKLKQAYKDAGKSTKIFGDK